MAEQNRDRWSHKSALHPLISSLLGRDKPAEGDTRESIEESMRFPVGILYGFAAGALFGLLPLALAVWLFKQSGWAAARAAIADTSSALFYLFWFAAGIATALLVTGTFILLAQVRPAAQGTNTWAVGPIPATGQDEKEDDDTPPE